VSDGLSGRDLALRLGAVQEAQRLGSRLVGTEHLLIATMTDPLVRRTFLSLGIELRHVQSVVTDLSGRREARGRGTRLGRELTPEAAEAIERLRRTVPDVAFAARAAPHVLSAALRALLTTLFTGPSDTAARTVLDELTTEHSRRVLIREVERNLPPPLMW